MLHRRLIAIVMITIINASAVAGQRNAAPVVPVLSAVEAEDLIFMREEEKLARDVYVELYQYYKEQGVELLIFAKIARSEQRHMDAILKMLDKYELDDPAAETVPGEFENPVLGDLYANLVSGSEENTPVLIEPSSGGKVSPLTGLYVGAWIEERDMIDVLHAIDNTSKADIVGVYTNLLCGSREHLRAFVKSIGADVYTPQLLYFAAETDDGVSPMETLEFWLSDASDEICM